MNWQEEGDEWLDRLWTALGEGVELTGRAMSTQQPSPELPASHLVLVPTSPTLRSRLRLAAFKERGLLAIITGTDSDTPEDSQVQPWLNAIEEASARIGQRHQIFEWATIIAERPNMMAQHNTLAAEATVGSLRLYPADHYLAEYSEPWTQPSLNVVNLFVSWPIIVKGQTRGYSWPVASKVATRSVHRLAALLSLAWSTCWTVRQVPNLLEAGQQLESPKQLSWQSPIPDELVVDFNRQPAPEWLDEAWRILDADQAIEDALLVHKEGLILQEEGHASFAMVAFVSSIEAIGAKLGGLQRCKKCGSMIGSAERFRRALALVVSDEGRRKALAKAAYGQRSTTAHAGRLHGGEASPGAWIHPSFFGQDEVLEFTGYLYGVRDASRDLLLRVLRERIPLPS